MRKKRKEKKRKKNNQTPRRRAGVRGGGERERERKKRKEYWTKLNKNKCNPPSPQKETTQKGTECLPSFYWHVSWRRYRKNNVYFYFLKKDFKYS